MKVFGFSFVTNSTSKMISSSLVLIFDCSIGFNKLKAVLGCLTPAVKKKWMNLVQTIIKFKNKSYSNHINDFIHAIFPAF